MTNESKQKAGGRAGASSPGSRAASGRSPGADSSRDGKPARKHVATGNPKGGKRPGAGRPQGSKNTLPLGAVKAIKVAGLRVPESATPQERQLADRALERIVDVMEERVFAFGGQAHAVLTAARGIREEICGKVADKHQLDGTVTIRFVSSYAEPPKEPTDG